MSQESKGEDRRAKEGKGGPKESKGRPKESKGGQRRAKESNVRAVMVPVFLGRATLLGTFGGRFRVDWRVPPGASRGRILGASGPSSRGLWGAVLDRGFGGHVPFYWGRVNTGKLREGFCSVPRVVLGLYICLQHIKLSLLIPTPNFLGTGWLRYVRSHLQNLYELAFWNLP